MDALVVLIILLPLISAAMTGIAQLAGVVKGELDEAFTAVSAFWTISMATLLLVALLILEGLGKNSGAFAVGTWLTSGTLTIIPQFSTSGVNLYLAAIFALLLTVNTKFSINYLHRESGFHRFFTILSLFSWSAFLVVLSDNMVFTFVGWEIAGLCSYLLIAYAYDRPVATLNATSIFVINRIGDAAFFLGIGLSAIWLETVSWRGLNDAVADLSKGEAAALAVCFVIAALVKSAQLPFSFWLTRAIEGPTPSSGVFYGAVMIHAGVFLVIQLQPLLDTTPLARAILVLSGGSTIVYAYFSGLTQTDVKSSLVFATLTQLGFMFAECGFGLWQLASWHLCGHAIVRGYLMMTAPSFIYNTKGGLIHPFKSGFTSSKLLFVAALQRFWLDQLNDWALVRPLRRLARDLSYFDDNVIDKMMGVPVPAMHAAAKLAEWEEDLLTPELQHNHRIANTGLVGTMMGRIGRLVHWFEDRLVLEGIAKDTLLVGRSLGHMANKFEVLVLRPRYLVFFVLITFLVAF